MIRTHTIAFLGLDEAAEALGIHPNNLSALARAGTVPAAKVGKEWRFLDVDIAEFLRSQYPTNKRETACHSTSAGKRGGTTSRSRAGHGIEAALDALIGTRPNASTTNARPNSGKSALSVVRNAPGTTPASPG